MKKSWIYILSSACTMVGIAHFAELGNYTIIQKLIMMIILSIPCAVFWATIEKINKKLED